MKKLFSGLLLFLVSSVIMLSACVKAPEASFSANPVSGASSLAVTFIDQSTNKPQSWTWDFGDGTTSNEHNPSHSYNLVGTYSVILTTANSKGSNSLSRTALIKVSPGPIDRLEIQPKELALVVGASQQFGIKAFDQFNNEISNFSSTWGVTPEAGTIDGQGNLNAGNKPGTFTNAVKVDVKKDEITKTATSSVSLRVGPLSRITIAPAQTNLEIGANQKFEVKAFDRYDNEIKDASYNWFTKESIGTLDQSGSFTAGTKAGSFSKYIQVESRKDGAVVSANADISINPGPFNGLSLEPQDTALAINSTQQFVAKPQDEYGNEIQGMPVTWTLNGGGTIKDGLFTSGTVAGKYNNAVKARVARGALVKEASASITINPDPLDKVIVFPNPVDLGIGATQQFTAYGVDQFGNKLNNLSFTWAIKDGGKIDSNGLFIAGDNPATYKEVIKVDTVRDQTIKSGYASLTVLPDTIYFACERFTPIFTNICLMKANGESVSQVTKLSDPDKANTFSISPDGKRIVFEKETLDKNKNTWSGSIWIINIDGSGLSRLSGGFYPDWSPDGKKIVFYSTRDGNSQIYVMDSDGGNQVRLTNNTAADKYPSWSPDGKNIAFSSNRDGKYEIYVMDNNGGNVKRLTAQTGNNYYPDWSPDTSKISFASDRDGDLEIFTMNIDGSSQLKLTNNPKTNHRPSWSPDGKRIIFSSNMDGNYEIYIMDGDGRNQIRLTNHPATDSYPRFTPRKQGTKVDTAAQPSIVTNQTLFQSVEDAAAWVKPAVVRIKHSAGEGSGMIIDSQGYILTNNHVVENVPFATVILDDGQQFNGIVIGRDLVHDMAVLKISASNLRALTFGDSDQLKLGQKLIALGFPLDLPGSVTVTSGLFSATRKGSAPNMTWIQTDTAVNPGNSGGPLIAVTGEVMGMVTAGLREIDGIPITGISFAISSNTIRTYLFRLKAGEIITN